MCVLYNAGIATIIIKLCISFATLNFRLLQRVRGWWRVRIEQKRYLRERLEKKNMHYNAHHPSITHKKKINK